METKAHLFLSPPLPPPFPYPTRESNLCPYWEINPKAQDSFHFDIHCSKGITKYQVSALRVVFKPVLLSFYVTLILYVNCNSIHNHYFTPFLLQLTISKTLWLFAFRPFHCSALRQSLEVHPCPEKYRQGGDTRPVVVLFGWLLAKSCHLHKYGELYHQYGADVITVKLEVMEVRKIFCR